MKWEKEILEIYTLDIPKGNKIFPTSVDLRCKRIRDKWSIEDTFSIDDRKQEYVDATDAESKILEEEFIKYNRDIKISDIVNFDHSLISTENKIKDLIMNNDLGPNVTQDLELVLKNIKHCHQVYPVDIVKNVDDEFNAFLGPITCNGVGVTVAYYSKQDNKVFSKSYGKNFINRCKSLTREKNINLITQ